MHDKKIRKDFVLKEETPIHNTADFEPDDAVKELEFCHIRYKARNCSVTDSMCTNAMLLFGV